MNLEQRLRAKREEILLAAARHGARNVRIFGSVARGDAGSESDIDFLVDLEPGRSLFDHAALLVDLERLLECRVDVATERGLRPRLRDRVLREAIPLSGTIASACWTSSRRSTGSSTMPHVAGRQPSMAAAVSRILHVHHTPDFRAFWTSAPILYSATKRG
jgi:predicted nucleotidyltransferase